MGSSPGAGHWPRRCVPRWAAGGINIGASEAAEPIINYYRTRLPTGQLGARPRTSLSTDRYDYYVLAGPDRAMVEERHLHVVYQDAGLILAK